PDSKGNKGQNFKADKEVVKTNEEAEQEKNEKSSVPKENTKDVETFMQKMLEESSPQEEQLQQKPQQKRDDPIPYSMGEVNTEGV
ncbi:hypothetical protein A2U01_0065380, partial [Trifolium medium]|nr:hypothetical protein [Trifolium medium]